MRWGIAKITRRGSRRYRGDEDGDGDHSHSSHFKLVTCRCDESQVER
jgi:hypothetical protein